MTKALVFTLAVLTALELVTRLVLFPASADFVRFAGYDATAEELATASALRVAVIGNSSAEEGIDPPQLEAALSASLGQPVRVERFLADGSEIVTWHAMLQRFFWSTDVDVDVYVLNYFQSLADSPQFEYARVGLFFAPMSEWSYYLSEQLRTGPQRIDFVLSSLWATYGTRDRIRDRTLRAVVPNYGEFLERTGSAMKGGLRPMAAVEPQFTALDRIVEQASARESRVVVVAFPLRSTRYEIETQVTVRANEGLLTVIDMRNTPNLPPTAYRDEFHLIGAGRGTYTDALAARLAPVLQSFQDRIRPGLGPR